ncbi:MAG: immunoglobulin domain-containing protein [Planctomycetes bacterium]|nr:immunoglobulin domain-containing protein [Planctomycetota bacterium]
MGRVGFTIAIAGMVALCAGAESARGQCTYDWQAGHGIPVIRDAKLYATCFWDPDGTGPKPEYFVVAGDTEQYPQWNIMAWNGTTWQSLGGGLLADGEVTVNSLAVYQGDLYAGGNFKTADGVSANGIARFDGLAWHPLGAGLTPPEGFDSYDLLEGAFSLVVFEGKLVVGGWFATAGELDVANVAYWDGANWNAFASGLGEPQYLDFVWTFEVVNGELIAGGRFRIGSEFHGVARWTGQSWQPLAGLNGSVFDLAVWNNQLYAGGYIDSAGGFYCRNIARWNGIAWRPFGGGVDSAVRKLLPNGDALILSGDFSEAGGTFAYAIAAWNGSVFSPIGNGLTGFDSVHSIALKDEELVVAGYPGAALRTRSNETWREFDRGTGIDGWVTDTIKWGDEIVSCGASSDPKNPGVDMISRWNGSFLEPLAVGVGISDRQTMYTLGTYKGRLIVAGAFSQIDGTPCRGIAQWDGVRWSPLGEGIPGAVYSVAEFEDDLYVGGSFTVAGEVAAHKVARWDGAEWHAVGAGFNDSVWALAVFEDQLVVEGSFVYSGYTQLNCVGRWDGNQWLPIGSGFTGIPGQLSNGRVVLALEVYQDDLIAGGIFPLADGHPVRNLARWNGNTWCAFGDIEPLFSNVNALKSDGSKLVVGGYFSSVDGQTANNIVSWNGSSWSRLGGGVNGLVLSIAQRGTEIFVSGVFCIAGDYLSASFARYGPADPAPEITQHPASPSVCVGSAISLRATAAGDGALSYRWRKSGVELVDGGEMMGAQTNTLVFVHAGVGDAGEYDCVVKLNDCTQATSNVATLTVYPTNTADGNGDGVVDGRDVQGMVDALVGFSPVSAGLCAYELNGDGIVNEADVAGFVGRALGG